MAAFLKPRALLPPGSHGFPSREKRAEPASFPTAAVVAMVRLPPEPILVLDLLPPPLAMAGFVAAVIVLALTPGPDMLLYLGKTIAQGRRAGLVTLGGALSGILAHTMLVAIGLSALIAASATAFTVVKVAGALYLIYLAFDAIRNGTRFSLRSDTVPEPLAALYLKGLFVNLLNPKIIVFFITFLPQFVSPGDSNPTARLLILGAGFIGVAVPICVAQILLAGAVADVLRRSPRATRAIDYVFAGVMGAFAVRLAFAEGK